MRRSTIYSASSWGLSVAAHTAAAVALLRVDPAPAMHRSDVARSREILLVAPPPSPDQTPIQPPEPKPEPAPVPPPPPTDPAAILGVDDGSDASKNWLGAAKETPHTGMKADQDQAQFTTAPGVPIVGSQSSPAPATAPASAQKPQPQEQTPLEPKPDAPPVETPPSPAQAAPQAPRQVAPSEEAPEIPESRIADKPDPGLKAPAPEQGPPEPPKQIAPDESTKLDVSPAGFLPPPVPDATPDGSEDSTDPARQLASPAPTPKPPDGAAIDPTAVPSDDGDPKSKLERLENPIDAVATKAQDQLIDQQQHTAKTAQRDPTQPPTPPEEAAPPTLPDIEARDEQLPVPPTSGASGAPGAEVAGDRPGNQSDRESDAAATMPAVSADRLGKPLAAKGLNIQTVRPRWATITTLTTSPKSPIVRIRFRRDGTVSDARFVEGFSTGYTEVDDPLLDAIHRWRARGRQLEQLPPGDQRGIVLVIKIQLK